MGFLDSLSKTLSSGVDRAKFETDKFQRTSRISGEVNNIKSQIDTNVRQLGERALELYQQGAISAPEIASLAQIIAQLRDQQTQRERELGDAQNETFEIWQASQPQQPTTGTGSQQVPISSDASSSYIPSQGASSTSYTAPTGDATSSYTPSQGGSSTGYSVPTGAASSAGSSFSGRGYDMPESNDLSGSGMINSSSIGSTSSGEALSTACPNCGYSVPGTAAFCPNCGNRISRT